MAIGEPLYDAAARKRQIRDAALAIVEHGGINDLTMRALGLRVGLSAAAIYDYYWCRDALVLELHEVATHRLLKALEASEPWDDQSNGILPMMQRFLNWSLDHPNLFDFLHGYTVSPEKRDQSAAALAVRVIARRAQRGGLSDHDATTLALTLWATAEGLLSLYRGDKIDVSGSEFPALYIRSVALLVDNDQTRAVLPNQS